MRQAHPVAWSDSPAGASGRSAINPSASQIDVNLAYEPKRKGLFWYRTYKTEFEANYVIPNPTPIAQTVYVSFTLPCIATVQGGFVSNAALGDNIIVYVIDDENFDRFENDQSISTFYNSGKVKSGTFDVTLSEGEYYIVMSNTYSSFSTKTVQFQAASICM